MKKSRALLIACNALLLCSSLSSIGQTSSNEIDVREENKYLAEGLECKDLLRVNRQKLRNADSASIVKDSIIAKERIKVSAGEVKLTGATKELSKTDELLQAQKVLTGKEEKRKKMWRVVALSLAGALVCVLTFLH